MGAPRFLVGAVGERSHHQLPPEEPVGGLSSANVHDAGCRRGSGQSGERMASAETSGTAVALEIEAVAQGHRLRTAARAAPALACRCFLYQLVGHVLLLVQRAGWVQSFSGALGSAGIDEGSGHREDSATSQRAVPGSQAASDLRQRAAVYRAGLQGVHSYLGDDARAHLAVLSAVERENRTLA